MLKVDSSPGKVIMDIGCNKGNDAMGWMERFDPSPVGFWDSGKWVSYYRSQHRVFFVCRWQAPRVKAAQLNPTPFFRAAGAPNTAVCVEPMRGNVRLLREAAAALGYGDKTDAGSFHVVQAAVTDRAEEGARVDFPDLRPGAESGSLTSASSNTTTSRVPLTTVDGIVRDLQLPKVDVLTIDTEGGDAAVLRGARGALASTRYLQFEVHRDLERSDWHSTTLRSVIDELSEQRFDCFWAGYNGRLLSISRCWNSSFEARGWGNVACVKRGDPWEAPLRNLAGLGPDVA